MSSSSPPAGAPASPPPGRLDRREVVHVATLARLGLTAAEIDLFAEQLGSVLRHMESLAELDLAGIEPTAQVIPLRNVLRPDEPQPSLPRADVLANAPRQEEGHFRVAPVFEDA